MTRPSRFDARDAVLFDRDRLLISNKIDARRIAPLEDRLMSSLLMMMMTFLGMHP